MERLSQDKKMLKLEDTNDDTKMDKIMIDIKKELDEIMVNIKREPSDSLEVQVKMEHSNATPTLKKSVLVELLEKPSCSNLRKWEAEFEQLRKSFKLSTFERISESATSVGMHSGEKLNKCDICDKSFSKKSDLERHSFAHSAEPSICTRCNTFSQKHSLIKHICIHTTEKTLYKCDVCGKCFASKTHLNSHVLTHKSEKSLLCETYDKSFYEKHYLNKRKFNKTGVRPYKCDKCKKSFKQFDSLKKHFRKKCSRRKFNLVNDMLMHYGVKPYKCEVCGRGFTLRRSLNLHTLTHA